MVVSGRGLCTSTPSATHLRVSFFPEATHKERLRVPNSALKSELYKNLLQGSETVTRAMLGSNR